MRTTLYIRTDRGTASVLGISQPDGVIVAETASHLAIRVPGHRYWAQGGPGPTHHYAPASIQVYAIEEREASGLLTTLRGTKVLEWEPGRGR